MVSAQEIFNEDFIVISIEIDINRLTMYSLHAYGLRGGFWNDFEWGIFSNYYITCESSQGRDFYIIRPFSDYQQTSDNSSLMQRNSFYISVNSINIDAINSLFYVFVSMINDSLWG